MGVQITLKGLNVQPIWWLGTSRKSQGHVCNEAESIVLAGNLSTLL